MVKARVLRTCHQRVGEEWFTFEAGGVYEVNQALQDCVNLGKTEVTPVEPEGEGPAGASEDELLSKLESSDRKKLVGIAKAKDIEVTGRERSATLIKKIREGVADGLREIAGLLD